LVLLTPHPTNNATAGDDRPGPIWTLSSIHFCCEPRRHGPGDVTMRDDQAGLS
jgi:hypothetical protein